MKRPSWRRRQDDELDEEIRSHLAMAVNDRVERGESIADASAHERRAQDARYGVRLLVKSHVFTATAVLSLALGIGAVSTVFALINAIELRTLPVARPGELVWLKDPSFSFPIFREVHDRGWMFGGLFAWQLRDLSVRWGE